MLVVDQQKRDCFAGCVYSGCNEPNSVVLPDAVDFYIVIVSTAIF